MLNEMTCWSSVTLVLLGSVLKENKVSLRCTALAKSLPEKKNIANICTKFEEIPSSCNECESWMSLCIPDCGEKTVPGRMKDCSEYWSHNLHL